MALKELLNVFGLQRSDGLTKDQLDPIVRYFNHLADVDRDLAARVIRYVIDGTDDDVLLTLGGSKPASEALGFAGHSAANWQRLQHLGKERATIFGLASQLAPALWIRLAQTLEAVQRAAGSAAPAIPQGWPRWLAVLFNELAFGRQYYYGQQDSIGWSAGLVEAVLQEGGLAPDLLARVVLDPKGSGAGAGGYSHYTHYLAQVLIEWPPYLTKHRPLVREILAQSDADNRVAILRFLGQVTFDCAPLADLLVEIATASAKTAREATLPFLRHHPSEARPLIEKVLAEGDAGRRHEAAQLLWRLYGAEAGEVLRRHAETETSERIRQTIDKLLAAPAGTSGGEDLAASLPPLEVELGPVDLPDEVKAGLRDCFDKAYKLALEAYERQLEQWTAPNRPQWMTKPVKPEPVLDKQLDALIRFIEGKVEEIPPAVNSLAGFAQQVKFNEWLTSEVQLVHVVRLACTLGHLRVQGGGHLYWWRTNDLETYRAYCKCPFGLRELDAVVARLPGAQAGSIAQAWLSNNGRFQSFCDWEADAVWPVFAQHADILRTTLLPAGGTESQNYAWAQRRYNAFRVLAMFPQVPAGYMALLWDQALGESKTERPLAQAALARVPDKPAKILVALKDGRQTIRAAAAEWLGKLGDKAAIEPLKEVFRKEKQETVKGTIMTALEMLGADVHEFLDRDALLAEAEAGLSKKRPKGIDWMPLDRLPILHWEDTGEVVDPRIVQWWLVQGIQQKSPVPGPLLRRYLALCRPHETAALARFVLGSWITQDTRTLSAEEVAARAQQDADKQWAMFSQNQYWVNIYQGNKDNLFRQLLQNYSNACVGSAIDQKGMLALAAAAGDGECVKMCEQYIRNWFGNRLAQCKALVEVLAWTKHPLAIQVLLGLANRFRTRAIRKGAEEHVQALADREGWTLDELADRTIPDGGFERPTDDEGRPLGDQAALVLDYGARTFTVRLDDELQPAITTAEGKTIKSPPAAGKNDDADKAKAARKAFTDAKKTVKEVVKRQTERLYEALCTQRSWRFEEWKRYLADHPIVGKLCVRLVWAAFAPADERFLGCFRPLEDGTLTNEQDEGVHFEPDTLVRLGHAANTPAELGAAWTKHIEDYDLAPPFAQFGRPTYELPEARKNETDLKDFEGHVLTTFKLRGKATKLGYLRGEAEDGGWFYLYRKPFPSLALQAVLEFTGSSLPEEDRLAALRQMYFIPLKGERESAHSYLPNKLPLSKVPSVLLSECYNDLQQIAAEGTGFDPEWQKRSYY